MNRQAYLSDVREQLRARDWRRRVANLTDAGLPWVPIIGQNVYLRNHPSFASEMHAHTGCVEIVYCKKGICRYELEHATVVLKTGMALVTQPGQLHRRNDLRQGSETHYLLFRLPDAGCALEGISPVDSECLVCAKVNLAELTE